MEINYLQYLTGLITPVLYKTFSWIAKEGAWRFSKNFFINKMTDILKRHFSEPIMKGLAHFMAAIIEQNWDYILSLRSVEAIGKYVLNNIFKGSGDLIFGKTQEKTQKTWKQGTPIKFEKKK